MNYPTVNHVTGERTEAHAEGRASSASYSEVLLQLVKTDLALALAQVAALRRRLEPFNNFECGRDVDHAEQHLRAIEHRLGRH